MVRARKRSRFTIGTKNSVHKTISKRLIKQVNIIRSNMEKKMNLPKGSLPFVWVTDNLVVGFRKK